MCCGRAAGEGEFGEIFAWWKRLKAVCRRSAANLDVGAGKSAGRAGKEAAGRTLVGQLSGHRWFPRWIVLVGRSRSGPAAVRFVDLVRVVLRLVPVWSTRRSAAGRAKDRSPSCRKEAASRNERGRMGVDEGRRGLRYRGAKKGRQKGDSGN